MPDNATPPILLTRPRTASERFATQIRAALGDVAITIAPLMETVPCDVALSITPSDHFIFTSAAAVTACEDRFALSGHIAWCVGARTTQIAQAAGCDARSAEGDAADLVAVILAHKPGERLLHLRGAHSTGDVAGQLHRHGLRAEAHVIYDQVSQTPSPEFYAALRGPVAVPLFSPRSAALFAQACDGHLTGRPMIFALSPAVAEALPPSLAHTVHIAAAPTAPALIRAMTAVFLP